MGDYTLDDGSGPDPRFAAWVGTNAVSVGDYWYMACSEGLKDAKILAREIFGEPVRVYLEGLSGGASPWTSSTGGMVERRAQQVVRVRTER